MKSKFIFLPFLFLFIFQIAKAGSRKPEDVFAGQIIILDKRAPDRFKSTGAFIGYMKTHSKKHVWPRKNAEKEWRLEYMAFFKNPLNDFEVKCRFYDTTEERKFIAGDQIMTPKKGERVLASSIVLEQDQGFKVNRKYTMYLLGARNVLLAQATFWLRGKGESYSGKVTFTDEEAKIKDP